jgi:hypothetical protein
VPSLDLERKENDFLNASAGTMYKDIAKPGYYNHSTEISCVAREELKAELRFARREPGNSGMKSGYARRWCSRRK